MNSCEKTEAISVADHIKELRNKIFISIGAILLGALFTHIFHKEIISFLLKYSNNQDLIFLTPLDPFFFIVKIDIIGGLIIAFPVVIWVILNYISPAIPQKTKKYFTIFYFVSLFLGLIGLLYALFVTIPFSLKFLFSIIIEGIQNQISAKSYLNFIIGQSLLIMGIFQIPIIVIGGINIGFFNTKFLSEKRPIIYLVLTILMAIITPTTDVFNLAIVLVPCFVIFEISLLGQKIIDIFNKK